VARLLEQHLSLIHLFTSKILNRKKGSDGLSLISLTISTGYRFFVDGMQCYGPLANYHSRPFSWSAALNPSPMLTKSRSRNCGLRLAPLNGTHSLTLVIILENFSSTVAFELGMTAHEATLLVVGASSGSLTITPSPIGMMFMLSE